MPVELYERRRHRRYPVAGDARVMLGGVSGAFALADISATGVCVLLDTTDVQDATCGQQGICRIAADDLACPVEARVSLTRMRRLGNVWQAGMHFESISDEHRRVIRAYAALTRARVSRLYGAAGHA